MYLNIYPAPMNHLLFSFSSFGRYNGLLKVILFFLFISGINSYGHAQSLPHILEQAAQSETTYLPDFSYAGYQCGELPVPDIKEKVLYAADFGVVSNDGLDDSVALLAAMSAANKIEGPVVLQLPKGKVILSEILYIEKSHLVLRGTGSGEQGTVIYCPRPMMYLEDPEALAELREYLTQHNLSLIHI